MNLKEELLNFIQRKQRKTADFIGQRINQYPARKLKIGLVMAGLMIGTFCFLLIIGVIGTTESGHVLQIDSISVPQKLNPFSMDSLRSLPSKVIDSLEAIIKKYYTDQLNTNY